MTQFANGFVDMRADARHAVEVPVVVFDVSGVRIASGKVRDVSRSGAGVALPHCMTIPDKVVIVVGEARARGVVRWRGTACFGVKFDTPIPADHALLSSAPAR